MQKNKQTGDVFSLQMLVCCALLVALSIVCGKFLQIPVGEMLRFSFENLPILLAGILFGPLAGALVGVVADLLGCLAVGYVINPLITVGAALIGCVGGCVYRWLRGMPTAGRILLTVVAAHMIGSVLVKTFGLAQFYDIPFWLLLLWRLLNYTLVAGAEFFLLYMLLRNKGVRRMVDSFRRDGGNGDIS